MADKMSQWFSCLVGLLVHSVPTASAGTLGTDVHATNAWDASERSSETTIMTGYNTNHTCVRADRSDTTGYPEVTIQITVRMDYIPTTYSGETQQAWYHTESYSSWAEGGGLALNFGGGCLDNGRCGVQRFCVSGNTPQWPIFQHRFKEGERAHVWMYYNSNDKYAEMRINGSTGREDGSPDIINFTTARPLTFRQGTVGCWAALDYWGNDRLVQGAIENFTVSAGMVQPEYVPPPTPTTASGTGDPHLQNIHGERFDLMKPGKHVLISIPRGVGADNTMLRVQADARQIGDTCGEMYFQTLNITGSWAEARQAGGCHYAVSQSDAQTSQWVAFGKVELKVVVAHTDRNIMYLNVYAKHLGATGLPVGGLLGEDDHEDVSVPPETCVKRMSLKKRSGTSFVSQGAATSTAVASLS